MSDTFDPAALRKLLAAVPAAPWHVSESQPAPGVRTEGGWEVAYTSYADSGPAVAELIAVLRNQAGPLLDAHERLSRRLETAEAERNTAIKLERGATEQVVALSEALAETRRERDTWKQRANRALHRDVVGGEERYFARVEVDELRRDIDELRRDIDGLRRDIDGLTRWADGDEREDVPVDEIRDVLRKERWYAPKRAVPADTADEPKPAVAVDPNSCQHDGINARDHAWRWVEGVGWHTWSEPSDELRKARMLARREPAVPGADEQTTTARTCRECGHTADDHVPAEGSIRPIGCQRLDCDCSFTLFEIEVKP